MHERLERVVTDLLNLEECADILSRVRDCDHIIDIIHDRMAALEVERDELHARIEAQDAREEAALKREYWRMVL